MSAARDGWLVVFSRRAVAAGVLVLLGACGSDEPPTSPSAAPDAAAFADVAKRDGMASPVEADAATADPIRIRDATSGSGLDLVTTSGRMPS